MLRTLDPLTNVPNRLSWSSTENPPSVRTRVACLRETVGWSRRRVAAPERPTVTGDPATVTNGGESSVVRASMVRPPGQRIVQA